MKQKRPIALNQVCDLTCVTAVHIIAIIRIFFIVLQESEGRKCGGKLHTVIFFAYHYKKVS